MYQLIRQFLFLFDAEAVHHFSMTIFRIACRIPWIRDMIRKSSTPFGPGLATEFLGLPFSNPIGLAAGFDKNALYLTELEALGFGFVEIGTVTPLPQKGNDQPRLFRLPKDKALINRMGFNNDGVKVVAERLRKWRGAKELAVGSRQSAIGNTSANTGASTLDGKSQLPTANCKLPTAHCQLIIGGNIGKNKLTPNEDAWKDYEICFQELFDCVDYFVVNVSSPNTPGLRALQEKDSLRKILSHLQMINRQRGPKPLLLKIAPDLSTEQIDDVIDLATEIRLDGLVASNTTISRDHLLTPAQRLEQIGAGGLSGKPLTQRSTDIVRYISQKTNGQLPLIASGGIFTGADAREKIDAGGSLVQVWTGFIYEGPGIVKKICSSMNG